MKIKLIVTNTRRKNLVFVSDALTAHSLDEVIQLTSRGKIEEAYVVKRRSGTYIRTNSNVPTIDEFETMSLSAPQLFFELHQPTHAQSTPAFKRYIDLYVDNTAGIGKYIKAFGWHTAPLDAVKQRLQKHQAYIFDAVKQFNIDPHLLGAILIDEIARADFLEAVLDSIKGDLIGRNASAGVAQVKLATAYSLIRKGIYNPNLADKKLFEKLNNETRRRLYDYVRRPEHSISFAAANIRSLINDWSSQIDLTERPEILATLYHLPYRAPHKNPTSNGRGDQIANEFYHYAKEWLHKR